MATRHATAKGRMYEIDGVLLPSVTTVLSVIAKPALIKWAESSAKAATMAAAADLHEDLAKASPYASLSRASYVSTLEKRLGTMRHSERSLSQAAEIGTQTHALIEWTLRRELQQVVGPRPATTGPAEWAYMAFQDWAKSVALEPLRIEETVWSRAHGYAGTMDLVARVRGRETVIDFKTGKAVYAEAFLQNAAYAQALEEMGHGRIADGLIVRLPKTENDPAFEAVAVPDRASLLPVFLACLEVWRWWSAAEEASKATWLAKRRAAEIAVSVQS